MASGTVNPTSPSGAIAQPQVRQRELPEGVLFAGGYFESDSRSMQLQQPTQANLMGAGQNVAPIYFYPDGTTSDAELILMNDQNVFIMITLRSLTGIAKVSDLLSSNELPTKY